MPVYKRQEFWNAVGALVAFLSVFFVSDVVDSQLVINLVLALMALFGLANAGVVVFKHYKGKQK